MKRVQLLTVALIAAACAPAWAINKCTGADGKVAYQEAPCDRGAKASEVQAASGPSRPGQSWEFSRQRDDMTGRVTCFAGSPTIYTGYRGGYSRMVAVWLQVAISKPDAPVLTLRTSTSGSDLFHSDLSGMGIKVDANEFIPIMQKFSGHVLSFPDAIAGLLMQQLEGGKQARMRLRFWPYEQLHDTDPVSLTGFKQALALARECAAKAG